MTSTLSRFSRPSATSLMCSRRLSTPTSSRSPGGRVRTRTSWRSPPARGTGQRLAYELFVHERAIRLRGVEERRAESTAGRRAGPSPVGPRSGRRRRSSPCSRARPPRPPGRGFRVCASASPPVSAPQGEPSNPRRTAIPRLKDPSAMDDASRSTTHGSLLGGSGIGQLRIHRRRVVETLPCGNRLDVSFVAGRRKCVHEQIEAATNQTVTGVAAPGASWRILLRGWFTLAGAHPGAAPVASLPAWRRAGEPGSVVRARSYQAGPEGTI